MRQRLENQQDLHHFCEVNSFAELSTIDLRQRRPRVPDLPLALAPASQGHSTAVAPVSTAAASSSIFNAVHAAVSLSRGRKIIVGRDNKPCASALHEVARDIEGLCSFSRRIRSAPISQRFSTSLASRGDVAVVGPVSTAATSRCMTRWFAYAVRAIGVPKRGVR